MCGDWIGRAWEDAGGIRKNVRLSHACRELIVSKVKMENSAVSHSEVRVIEHGLKHWLKNAFNTCFSSLWNCGLTVQLYWENITRED